MCQKKENFGKKNNALAGIRTYNPAVKRTRCESVA
jgi:hypothetical protein